VTGRNRAWFNRLLERFGTPVGLALLNPIDVHAVKAEGYAHGSEALPRNLERLGIVVVLQDGVVSGFFPGKADDRAEHAVRLVRQKGAIGFVPEPKRYRLEFVGVYSR
jgi:hypothetical protein